MPMWLPGERSFRDDIDTIRAAMAQVAAVTGATRFIVLVGDDIPWRIDDLAGDLGSSVVEVQRDAWVRGVQVHDASGWAITHPSETPGAIHEQTARPILSHSVTSNEQVTPAATLVAD